MRTSDQTAEVIDSIDRGLIGSELVGIFAPDGSLIPTESELWDYKESVADSTVSYAETAKDIIAFHNTYGGYIIIGVAETIKDHGFEPTGFRLPDNFHASLRSALSRYASERINFLTSCFYVSDIALTVVYIPKRPKTTQPVFTVRNGPDKKPGKPLFDERTTYFRRKDECIKASIPEEWEFLNSARDASELLSSPTNLTPAKSINRLIPNNLPDRNLICAQLFGRQEIISELWGWIADDLEGIRLLAGLGGKGKTSIAYEFACSFYRNAPEYFEQVLWLSAKRFQFRADRNEYVELPECWYSSPLELLKSLSVATAAFTQDEIDDEELGEYQLIKALRESLKLIPSLIIVDDIDSLEENDQKRVFEIVQQISATAHSKFLLTTRANYAFSDAQCIRVPGLNGAAYTALVEDRLKRFGLPSLNTAQISKLSESSDGSPLWTDSILRLIRQGYKALEAIREWRSKPGEDARFAALEKELQALSHVARRVLYVASVLRECSRTELLYVTQIGKQQLGDALSELEALFLVDAPKFIETEPRFSIPEATAAAVVDAGSTLVPDHKALYSKARNYSKKASSSSASGKKKRIGFVVNQAISLIKTGDYEKAAATVNAALKTTPNHPDLLLLKGRCLRENDPDKAVTAFSQAFQHGQRRDLLFDLWFQVLCDKALHAHALDVANLALEHSQSQADWYSLRARTHAQISVQRKNEGNSEAAAHLLIKASSDLASAIKLTVDCSQRDLYAEDLEAVNDAAWKIVYGRTNIEDKLLAFDVAQKALEVKDFRPQSAEKLVIATRQLVQGEDLSGDTRSARAARTRVTDAIQALENAYAQIQDDHTKREALRAALSDLESIIKR